MEAATTCMYFTYIFVALVTAVNGLMGLTGKGSGKDPSVTVHYLIMMIMMMMTYFFWVNSPSSMASVVDFPI